VKYVMHVIVLEKP